MKNNNGVKWYTESTVKIYFPEDRVCCAFCPMLETYARNQCRRTGEYLVDIRATIGYECPLKFKQKKENGDG